MQITVIVCTRNRADQLRRTLEAASAIKIPRGLSWELLVVDNGSTDHTPQIVESFADRLPIRRVSEATPGLSNARNRGVAEARGAYICWTDDDVLVEQGWLAAYAEAFARHPEAAYFGGPIELVLEKPTPSWFEQNREVLGPILAERRFGDVSIPLDPAADVIPYGANYAVRAREQRLHSYDTQLGVSPTQRRVGEETTLLAAMHYAGCTGRWVPSARVRHVIPADRQTLPYLAEYRRAAGETSAYLAEHGPPAVAERSLRLSRWSFRGAPLLWSFREAHRVLFHATRRIAPSRVWLRHWLRSAYYDGAIAYYQSQRNGRNEVLPP